MSLYVFLTDYSCAYTGS